MDDAVPGRRVGRSRLAVLAAMLVVTTLMVNAPVDASDEASTGAGVVVVAVFEGAELDLSGDWGDATACLIWDELGIRECFRTEAEMDKRIAGLESDATSKSSVSATTTSLCSSSVRLYDGVVYTGNVLNLRNQYQWINLSGYGFSNKTSSFKIGACSSIFADYDWGGGSRYPTSATQAWDVASVMASGWGNRVSSIYIG